MAQSILSNQAQPGVTFLNLNPRLRSCEIRTPHGRYVYPQWGRFGIQTFSGIGKQMPGGRVESLNEPLEKSGRGALADPSTTLGAPRCTC